MNPKAQPFYDAVDAYQEFKNQFEKFCEVCVNRLNNNPHLPGVSFTNENNEAKLNAFGLNFNMIFTFLAIDSMKLGKFEVLLPQGDQKEAVILMRFFFDSLGNVKSTIDATYSTYSLASPDFIEAFLGDLANSYFSHLGKSL